MESPYSDHNSILSQTFDLMAVVSRNSKRDQGMQNQAVSIQAEAQTLYKTANRSEEHTSELQSLMRISYAVFCLKKKTQNQSLRTPLPPYAYRTHTTRPTSDHTTQLH